MQKYTILVQYHKAGENSAMQGTSHEGYGSGEDTEIVEVDGKKYRKVQIIDKDEEYLMDDDNNIYDLQLNRIGTAGESDAEEDDL